MTMNVPVATKRIQRQLPEAEHLIGEALIASARLMETMLVARRDTGVTGQSGQVALLKLMESQKSLIAAENDMLRVHRELLKVGLSVNAGVDHDYCPPSSGELAPSAQSLAA